MSRLFTGLLVCGLLCAAARAEDDEVMRVWRSNSGTELRAVLIRQGGGRAVLKQEDGEQVTISISALSAADQTYLNERADREAAEKEKKRAEFFAKKKAGRAKPKAERVDDIDADWLSNVEKDVIKEMNLARSDPADYARFLKQYKARHVGNGVFATARGNVTTQEGVAAVQEAIDFLLEAKPAHPLRPSRGLSLAARAHADDIGPAGLVSHEGTDGSTLGQRIEEQGRWKDTIGENLAFGAQSARDFVVQLIIDDGVPGRGHRANIFQPAFRVAGVAVGPHKTYGTMCVIDYAGGFRD